MSKLCSVCNQFERGHPKSVSYTYSTCVQWLLRFTQDALKQYHKSILKAGLKEKADAVNSFINLEEVQYVRPKTKKSKRNFNRERSHRVIRNQKDWT